MHRRLVLPVLTAALALPGQALAHHPMGGAAPTTALEGLLSGIGHPIIGIDHLAFVIAAGMLAAGAPTRATRLGLPLLFLGFGVLGTLLHLGGIGLGPVEAVIAASLLAVGGLLLRQDAAGTPMLGALFAAAGLFHGHAFAEAVVGSETGPVLAYLIGLTATQAAIAFGAMAVTRRISAVPPLALRRLAGITASAVGVFAGVLAAMG